MERLRSYKTFTILVLIFLMLGGFAFVSKSNAAIRKEFNYQGKLTDSGGTAVTDGAYDVVFKIYTQAGGGAAVWTESWTNAALFTETATTMTNDGCATGIDKVAYTTDTNEGTIKAGQTLWNVTTKQSAVIESVDTTSNFICIYDPAAAWTTGDDVTNRVYVKNGLFSTMVGSVTDLTVDFTADTYYLGVTIGADSEMVPRKKIGSVPQAWNANNLVGNGYIDIDNTSTSQDGANINYNPASGTYNALSVVYGSGGGTGTALSVTQSGTGSILDLKDGSTSVFTVADGGSVTMTGLSFTQNMVNPVHKGSIFEDGTTYMTGARAVAVQGKYAYVSSRTDNSVEVIDISNPASPTHIGYIVDDVNTALDSARSIYVLGKYAYVVGYDESGVEVLDISNPASPTHVAAIFDGASTLLGGAYSIYVQGKYAYVAANTESGLEILDISNPANPTHIGSIADDGTTAMGGAYDVFVQGKYAYVVGNTDNGLEILDVSNPASPTHIGSIVDDGTTALAGAYSVYVSGRYAYVASRTDNGLEIIDVSNPASPTHVAALVDDGTTALSGASYVVVSGKYAYVTSINEGVEVVNVSVPASPTHAGAIFDDVTTELSGARTIAIQGKYAYVASYPDDGMEVLELAGLDVPTANIGDLAVSTIDVTDSASVAGNLFVGDTLNVGSGGIYSIGSIIGYANSTQTALTITQGSTGDIVDFKDGATSVFKIADGGNITMNGLTFQQNAVNPAYKGSLIDATHFGSPQSVYVQGKYAYIAGSSTDSLAIVDISVSSSPVYAGYYTSGTYIDGANSVYVSGRYAYVVGSTSNSLAVIDVSNPTSPAYVGSYISGTYIGSAHSIYVSGRYAYVTGSSTNSLAIIDVSNPASPAYVGSYISGTYIGGARSVYIQGRYAYVAGFTTNSLAIIDISNPASPAYVGSYISAPATNGANSVYVSGKYAYLACTGANYFLTIDVSNPASPTQVGYTAPASEVSGKLYVAGRYAYVAGPGTDILNIINISNPASLSGAGSYTSGTYIDGASSVYISGKYAYVTGATSNSLAILEIAGFDLPSANIGDLNVSTLDVTENASIANDLYVGNGLNVGAGGIYSAGPLSAYVNSGATALTVNQSGTGDLVDVMDSGVSIFKVGQGSVTITRPLDLQVEGDTGLEYNLNFLNNSASYINSAGPLTISAGDSNSYEHLTLTTGGTGDVIVDIANSLLGFRVTGAQGNVFSIDATGNIIAQGGSINLSGLATPTGVTVTPTGTAGVTTYGYRISAITANGETLASATAETTTGNATLDGTNYNHIIWNAVSGASGYKVYGRTSGAELYMATVTAPTTYYNDTAAATPSGALPTANTTGGVISYPSTGGPKRSIVLTAGGAETPSSNGAAQTKVTGTNHAYYVLDYDAATDESSYWHWTMPDSYDGGKVDITYYWEAAATSGEVGWCFQAVGIAPNNAEDIDPSLSTAVCEVDTAQGNANDLASVTEVQATSNFSPGEYVAFKIFRDADQSTVGAGNDDMTGDARLVKVKIEYSVNAESD